MIEIINYQPKHQPWFEKLNRHWIEKYFWMEPIDFDVLQHPEVHILSKGGYILMATYHNEIVGTAALKFANEGVYEFTKMAVNEKHQGKKIGLALTMAAIEKVKLLDATSIILYSSTKLETAISLYRRIGFVEIPIDGQYQRSDIKMELKFSGVRIRHASVADRDLLIELGIQTFRETFDEVNTAEDMQAYLDKSFSTQQLEKELNEEGSTFFLAFYNEEAIGYVRLRTSHNYENPEYTSTLEIERLYLLKSQLGKNVGKKLMETCLALAKTKKCSSIWLGVWEHNQRALRFYDKWGFVKFSSHVFMLGSDAQTDLLLKKNL
jgi:ribosomal protein S18 acetylase RimI-like enzyme